MLSLLLLIACGGDSGIKKVNDDKTVEDMVEMFSQLMINPDQNIFASYIYSDSGITWIYFDDVDSWGQYTAQEFYVLIKGYGFTKFEVTNIEIEYEQNDPEYTHVIASGDLSYEDKYTDFNDMNPSVHFQLLKIYNTWYVLELILSYN